MIPNNQKGEKAKTKEGGPQNKPETGEPINTKTQESEQRESEQETGGKYPNKSKTGDRTNTEPKKSEWTEKQNETGEEKTENPISLGNTREENENEVLVK